MITSRNVYFGLLWFFWLAASASAQDQAPAPVFKEGDAWQFNIMSKGQLTSSSERITGIYELVLSQGKVKVYEVSGNQKTELEIKPGGPADGLAALVGSHELRPTLKFPLSVGQKWTYEYETRPAGAKENQKRFVEVAVTGMEQVTTSAGSFKGYRLVRSEKWRGGGRTVVWNGNTITYFYSPETRSVVKSSTVSDSGPGSAETELIKFTPGN